MSETSRARRALRSTALDQGSVELSTDVGGVVLANPVLTASGTVGHGVELAAYLDLAALGAVVVKSVAAFAWSGNPAPRVHPVRAGMLNSVGLQGRGVQAWLADDLPELLATGATVVASVWGRTVDEYAQAARALADAPAGVVAVEVNLSCPNLEGKGMFAQSVEATTAAMRASEACGRPRWAKLTAAVASVPDIARAAVAGGASGVTLVNTLPGMAIDIDRRRPILGAGSGGLSGPAIHPVAVKAVWDVRAALPEVSIIGVGGVAGVGDVVELMMAGADAVAIGTATFADPRAPVRILDDLVTWCRSNGIARTRDLVARAHHRPETP